MANDLIGPEELAEYLGIPLPSVYTMNSRGTGPRRIRVGKHVRYRKADVDRWLDERSIEPEVV